jgi:hypothetical protein
MPQQFEPVPRLSLARRRVMRAAGALAGAAVAAPLVARLAIGQPRFAG